MIDPTDPRSPSRQIADDLRKEIRDGVLAPGARLPSERELVERYGTSPQTARQAVSHLKGEGLVVGMPGRGVFVRERPPVLRVGSDRYARWRRVQGKAPLQAEVEELGLKWRQEVLELAEVPSPDWVASWYEVEPDTPLFVRRRRFWIDGNPSQLADSYYLLDLVKGTRITEENTGPGGGYRVLEELGYPLTRVREEVAIRMPTPDEVRALRLEPGTPVAELHRVSFSGDKPIEVLQGILAGDRYVFCYDMPVND
ncbi:MULTISPECIES: GntR family transcriptional regulator [Actinomadura]|uniref:UTRA domain-containing protein n=1 Tax=Actinomadura litoris TaxID=2678616 RepID=A0A7K1L353_9ACTN|nr:MULTISPECIES: GntR family transcriptional regulator [Actinomadura]MBT2208698.1 GntR family transcriptional regulator [Actinomadura sp. NEAU-AAG7]MUN38733.1 UTRA domain-containing protein [Actinomadura litoris]